MAKFAETAQDAEVREMAELVQKVLVKKVDQSLLREIYEKRVADLSGRWVYRFRDCFMEEIRYGMDLDTILRRISTSGGSSGEEETQDDEDGGTEEGGDESGDVDPSDPPSGEVPGPGEGGQTPPGQGNWGNFNQVRRRVAIRGEVVEWDILHWFEKLGYFPDSLFRKRP